MAFLVFSLSLSLSLSLVLLLLFYLFTLHGLFTRGLLSPFPPPPLFYYYYHYYFIYLLYIPLTALVLFSPLSIPFNAIVALQVSAGLCTSSPTEASQGNPARRTYAMYRQQLLGQPPFHLFETHMKTKLHICYKSTGRPSSNPCMLFGWWFRL
jgi:predicted membrane metal-binding protein